MENITEQPYKDKLVERGLYEGTEGYWVEEEGGNKTFFAFWDEGYKAIQRLFEYQSTGLTPQEIVDGKILTGWIPVSERLPDKYGQYLTQDSYDLINIFSYYDGWNCCCNRNGTIYRKHEIEDVVAWMPLPKTWKGEIKND